MCAPLPSHTNNKEHNTWVNVKPCAAGGPGQFYNRSAGNTGISCQYCPAGAYQNAPNMEPTCSPCSYNQYTPGAGSTACRQCPAGQYRSASMGDKCLSCARGHATVKDGVGQCCESIAGLDIRCVPAPDFPSSSSALGGSRSTVRFLLLGRTHCSPHTGEDVRLSVGHPRVAVRYPSTQFDVYFLAVSTIINHARSACATNAAVGYLSGKRCAGGSTFLDLSPKASTGGNINFQRYLIAMVKGTSPVTGGFPFGASITVESMGRTLERCSNSNFLSVASLKSCANTRVLFGSKTNEGTDSWVIQAVPGEPGNVTIVNAVRCLMHSPALPLTHRPPRPPAPDPTHEPCRHVEHTSAPTSILESAPSVDSSRLNSLLLVILWGSSNGKL